jgi:hypothetical protein
MASRFVVVVRKCMFDLIPRLHGVLVHVLSSFLVSIAVCVMSPVDGCLHLITCKLSDSASLHVLPPFINIRYFRFVKKNI